MDCSWHKILMPYRSNPRRRFANNEYEISMDEIESAQHDEDQFVVEDIFDITEATATTKLVRKGDVLLRVSWRGYTDEYDTWEPVAQLLQDVPQLVWKFLRSVEATEPLAQRCFNEFEAKGKRRRRRKRKQK